MSEKIEKVINFGCRLNIYEGEVIRNSLLEAEREDVVVFNTCAVTMEAEKQARQAIRRMKREHPNRKIFVTGCAVQVNPDSFASMEEVDRVIGNNDKLFAKNYMVDVADKIIVDDIMRIKESSAHLVSSFEGKARAFIEVQNGCNHRCTFCIIPFGRGNNRSVPIGAIVEQVRKLVANNYKEIVFTGVDITGYGSDLPGSPTFGQMIRRVLNLVPDLVRLRLSSVDVAEIDDELFDLITTEPRLMPHIHLSLQSGNDMILKRMKRRHLRADIIDFVTRVRKVREDVVFGADIIAGFPTETEEMFNDSLSLVSEMGLVYLHVFPYSAREGTPAAKMPSLPMVVRRARAKKIREAGELELNKFQQTQIGKMLKLMVEKDNIARAENYITVKLDKDFEPGDILEAIVTEVRDNQLYARALPC